MIFTVLGKIRGALTTSCALGHTKISSIGSYLQASIRGFQIWKEHNKIQNRLEKGYNEIQTHTCGSPDKGVSHTGWVKLKRLHRSDIWAKPQRMNRMLLGMGGGRKRHIGIQSNHISCTSARAGQKVVWCTLHKAKTSQNRAITLVSILNS